MNLQLILDVVLEHADTMTLLDYLFVCKHTYNVVMRILQVEFKLIRTFSKLLHGEIYPGIKYFTGEFYLSHLQDYRNYRKKTRKFDALQNIHAKNIEILALNMMIVYGRLYKFKINPKADYIRDSDFEECEVFVDDFINYAELYHYKISRKLLGCLIWDAYRRGRCDELIHILLSKGFDIDQYLTINFRQTILHFCVYYNIWDVADAILDKRPNIYLYDKNGNSVYRLMKDKNRTNCPGSVLDKFRLLVAEQKYTKLKWHT